MSKNGIDILKAMAQQAKDRLRGRTERISNETYQRNFKVLYNNKAAIRSVIISSKEDEKFYNKVKSIVDRNSMLEPISELIDKQYYKSLDAEGKERYFFKTVDKYREFKKRYECEKEKQVCNNN